MIDEYNQAQFRFTANSQNFVQQLQHLLLRFGILTKRKICDKNESTPSTEALSIIGSDSIREFITNISGVNKENNFYRLLIQLSNNPAELEYLPKSIASYIMSLKGEKTWKAILKENPIVQSEGNELHFAALDEGLLCKNNAVFFAKLFNDSYLQNLSCADVYWDEVVAITPKGEQQVYDLTIPKLHNFIAQDICVHNTTFAMNLVENALLLEDKPVLVFSLEMPSEQIMMRMLASLSRVNQTSIRTARLNDDDWGRIQSSMVMLKDRDNLYIDDSSGLTPMEVRTRARKLARDKGGISLIMIDYLQLMRVPSLSENRTLEISEISRSLKALAKELKCPVVALSQLNRGLEQRADKRPINSDLRESGAIEQDADLIMFIYRDEVYNENSDIKGVAEIIIGKQRNGPIGTTRLTFQGQFSRFDNYTGPDYSDE